MKTVSCEYCFRKVQKRTGDFNRAKKRGAPMYCDKYCAGLGRRIDINIENKNCSSCREDLPSNKFRSRTIRGEKYLVARCKKCEIGFNKMQADPEKRRSAETKRRRILKNTINQRQREWRANNIEKNRAFQRKHIKKQVDELSDSYISRMFGIKEMPIALIRVKRMHLICKRKLKTINHESQRTSR